MLPDWYREMAAATGPSMVPGFANADVAIAAVAVFAVFLVVTVALQSQWTLDVAFVALVAGGLAVTWPAMTAITAAALVVLATVSFAHKALWPERQARIDADAGRRASSAVASIAQDAGLDPAEVQRVLREAPKGPR